jgi:hypothetical protein
MALADTAIGYRSLVLPYSAPGRSGLVALSARCPRCTLRQSATAQSDGLAAVARFYSQKRLYLEVGKPELRQLRNIPQNGSEYRMASPAPPPPAGPGRAAESD